MQAPRPQAPHTASGTHALLCVPPGHVGRASGAPEVNAHRASGPGEERRRWPGAGGDVHGKPGQGGHCRHGACPAVRARVLRGAGLPLYTPCSPSGGLGGRWRGGEGGGGCSDPHSACSASDEAGSSQPAGGGRTPTPSPQSGTRPSPHGAGERADTVAGAPGPPWCGWAVTGKVSSAPGARAAGGGRQGPGGPGAGDRITSIFSGTTATEGPRVRLSRGLIRDPQQPAGRTWFGDPTVWHGHACAAGARTVAATWDPEPSPAAARSVLHRRTRFCSIRLFANSPDRPGRTPLPRVTVRVGVPHRRL